MKDRAENAIEKTKDYAYNTKESAKDVVGTVADKSRKGTERMKEKTKEVAVSTERH